MTPELLAILHDIANLAKRAKDLAAPPPAPLRLVIELQPGTPREILGYALAHINAVWRAAPEGLLMEDSRRNPETYYPVRDAIGVVVGRWWWSWSGTPPS